MGKRILIVDDEPSIVVSLEFLMKREGFDVEVAPNGEAALAAIDRRAPDLLLLDLVLPGVSGFDVCQRVRADPRLRDVKIIVLTARGGVSDRHKGLDVGADRYVTKPFSTKDVVAQVKQLLEAEVSSA